MGTPCCCSFRYVDCNVLPQSSLKACDEEHFVLSLESNEFRHPIYCFRPQEDMARFSCRYPKAHSRVCEPLSVHPKSVDVNFAFECGNSEATGILSLWPPHISFTGYLNNSSLSRMHASTNILTQKQPSARWNVICWSEIVKTSGLHSFSNGTRFSGLGLIIFEQESRI